MTLSFWRQWGPAFITGSLCVGFSAFVWTIADPSYRQPTGHTHNQSGLASESAANSGEDDKAANDRWTLRFVGVTALFTGGLFVVGLAQAALFFWQLRLIHASLTDTKTAAEAARLGAEGAMLQAKALISIERPIVTIANMVLRHPSFSADDVPGPLIARFPETFACIVVTFQNSGRTAAVAKRLCLNWEIAETLPTVPVYKDTYNEILAINSVIQSDGTLEYSPKTRWIMPTPEQHKMLEDGVLNLWVYGFLEFEDFFETKYTYGFRRLWEVPRGISFIKIGLR